MKIRTRGLGSLSLLLAASGTAAYAQTVTTGAIQVTVLDASGSPVSGAQVRVSSGQITRTVVTGNDGRAMFPLLNAGGWQIKVNKEGLAAQSQSVSVSLNETKPVNVRMGKESQATVEVVAAARTVDQTSTTTGATLSLETVDVLPKGRDVAGLIFLSPGVSSGGFASNGLDVSINGASGAENSWNIDGLSATDFRYGSRGATLNTDFVDQVEVQTGGFKPEFSALGGVFNVLTKSGTNEFQGTASFSTAPTGLQPKPKRTVFTQENYQTGGTDLAAWIGGALVKDKLFYSVGAYGEFTTQPGITNFSGFKSDDAKGNNEQYFMKVNWFLTPDQQFTFNLTHNGNRTKQDHAVPNGFGDGEVGATVDYNTNGASIGYDYTITPTLYLSAKLGQNRIISKTAPTAAEIPIINDRHWFQGATANQAVAGGGAGTLPSYLTDDTTIYQRGGYGLYSREYNIAKQGSVSLTWVLGNHSLKGGFSDLESTYQLWERVSGDHRYTIDRDGGRLRDRVISNNAQVRAVYRAYYIQDTWQATNNLNVFFGARAEHQDQIDGQGHTFLSFAAKKYIQPRIGFTWDIVGNGKSKLFGNYGLYYEAMPQRMAIREFTKEYFVEDRWNSVQRGGTYVYSAANHNNPGTYSGPSDAQVDYGAAFQFPSVQEGIKLPRRHEIQLGYQQSFENGWTAGATFKYRKLEHIIEDSVFVGTTYDVDGNADALVDRYGNHEPNDNEPAVIWNPGSTLKYRNRQTGQYYDFTGIDTHYPEAYNKYRALELTLEKKSDRAFFSASYVLSRLEGNYEGLVSSSNGQPDANITASWDYWPYVGTGLLPLDHTHTLKLYGSYRLDVANHPLTVGANFFAQTGSPISHFDDGSGTHGMPAGFDTTNNDGSGTVFNPNGGQPLYTSLDYGFYGDSIPVNFKLGQFGRRPTTTKLDLHADMEFAFGAKTKLIPSIDIFNVYNSRPVTQTVELLTDQAGGPQPAGYADSALAWQTGRSFRFGVKLKF